jgi:hypothetical protein
MYRLPGVRSGAWLTEKEETYKSPKGISNYGLMPVPYKNEKEQWEKTKKEIGQDFQKLQKSAVTASRKTKDAIKKAYDWTGVWGPSTLGSAAGLGYVWSQYPGDEYGWLKGALMGSLITSGTKLWRRVERKWNAYKTEKEKSRNNLQKKALKSEYFNVMEKLMRSDLQPDEKVDVRYIMAVDKFTPKLFGENGYKADQLKRDLESMKTCLKRYMETRKCESTESGDEKRKAA